LVVSGSALEEILVLAPEWRPVLQSVANIAGSEAVPGQSVIGLNDLLQRLGAKALYLKALSLNDKCPQFLSLVRDYYYQPMFARMLSSNQNLRRFLSQRRQPLDFQKNQAISMATELAQKLEGVLARHIANASQDGFKVLLPAYAQRSVHNAVIDYIKEECQWEKETLQDLNLSPEQEDPRQNTADDIKYAPEHRALSGEKVAQLNQLRVELAAMLADKSLQHEPLIVVDCMFGLGLTKKSKVEQELTMREVCDLLAIAGETQARKIARCQVLLDKGLDMIRTNVRKKLPGLADCWQTDININTASRRELSHQLSLTEGEVEKLIGARQYLSLEELVERSVIKSTRLHELTKNGAVACFVPVDLNACTTRDMIDILALDKERAQKIVASRPLNGFAQACQLGLLDDATIEKLRARGAVLKSTGVNKRLDLNLASADALAQLGLNQDTVKKIERGRPFATWGELEEYLIVSGAMPDSFNCAIWQTLRQKSCLSISPG